MYIIYSLYFQSTTMDYKSCYLIRNVCFKRNSLQLHKLLKFLTK